MIYAHKWRSVFSPGAKKTTLVPWRRGMLAMHAMPADGGPYVCVRQGEIIEDTDPIFDCDHLDFIKRPGGPELTAAQIAGKLFVSFVISIAASKILSWIYAARDKPTTRDENSAQYGFNGIENNRNEGAPRQIVFGELLVGGTIIDEYSRVVDDNTSPSEDYYALIAFGEGPVQSICGRTVDTAQLAPLFPGSTDEATTLLPDQFYLEGNDATNFDGVEVHIRLGTLQQSPIEGFDKSRSVAQVGATLTQVEATSPQYVIDWDPSNNANPTKPVYNDNSAPTQAIWDQFGFAFTLDDDADSAFVTMNFPQGLFKLGNSGGLADATFAMAIRYIEVDDDGNSITTGGDNSDGYVYLPPKAPLIRQIQGPFQSEYAVRFSDPAQWPVGGASPGGVMTVDGSAGAYAFNAAPTLPAFNAGDPDEMTFSLWIHPLSLPSSAASAGSTVSVFEWLNADIHGFGMRLRRIHATTGSSEWDTLEASIGRGNGTALALFSAPQFNGPEVRITAGEWTMCSITYKKNDQWRVYINGDLVISTPAQQNNRLVGHTSGFRIGQRDLLTNAFGETNFDGHIDEIVWYNRRFSDSEIIGLYGSGGGVSTAWTASQTDLLSAWQFDEDFPSATTAIDLNTTNSNDLTAAGNCVFDDHITSGVIFDIDNVTTKRARYKVECLRIYEKSRSIRIQDESVWQAITSEIDANFSHPGMPLVGIKVRASEQINTNTPTMLARVKGQICPVWDGVSVTEPQFTQEYTANPAWVALKYLTDPIWGEGDVFPPRNVDMESLQEVADESDTFVYDGRGKQVAQVESGVPAIVATGTWEGLSWVAPAAGNQNNGLLVIFWDGGGGNQRSKQPPHWKPGRFVAFDQMALPADINGLDYDLNHDANPGNQFEIVREVFDGPSGSWTTEIYWNGSATPPWSGGSYQSTLLANATSIVGRAFTVSRRYEFNGVIDTQGTSWDTLVNLLRMARTMPVPEGNRMRFRIERKRAAVGLVTNASVIREGDRSTFEYEYADGTERPNSISIDFLDENSGFDRSVETVTSDAVDTGQVFAVEESISLLGETNRLRARRFGRWTLAVNQLLSLTGQFRTGPKAIAWEPGDVVMLSHHLVPWGQGGRVVEEPGSGVAEIKLSRPITLGNQIYFVRVFHPTQQAMETIRISDGAGTYAAGTAITLVVPWVRAPGVGEEFIVFHTGEIFLAQIVGWQFGSDKNVTVRWVEYRDDVYDAELIEDDETLPAELTLPGPSGNPRGTVPLNPTDVGVREISSRQGGRVQSQLAVSWRLEDSTRSVVEKVRVWWRVQAGVWAVGGTTWGKAASILFPIDELALESFVEVAVQPVAASGAARRPASCSKAGVQILRLGGAPQPPTGLTGRLEGDLAVYAWTAPTDSQEIVYELRVGGWILGQTLGESAPGATELRLPGWISAKADAAGLSAPGLVLRARDTRGRYSGAARLDDFNPSLGESEIHDPLREGTYQFADTCWQDFGSGWVI